MVIHPTSIFGLKITKQLEFYKDGMDLIASSRKRFFNKPYRLLTTLGEVIVLPAYYGGVIHNDRRLNFRRAVFEDTGGDVSGFEPFAYLDHPTEMIQKMVKNHLTVYLNKVTAPLSAEATFAVNHIFGSSSEWQTFQLQESVASLIARLSSRVFLGKELCRNEEWLEITSSWTRNAFTASLKMAAIPPFFKPMVSYLLPYCRTIRWQCRRGREIIAPVIEKRRRLKEQARKNGEPIPEFNDALEWAEQEHQGKSYDPAHVQLFLSFAAIHTTTDLVCETLLCLASDPTQIKPLREEIAQELSRGGLKKTSLYSMKLLDSAIKEAQRIKPTGKLALRRKATENITLEGDIRVRKGDRVFVDMTPMWDPTVYPNPDTYDMYRFLRMREQPGAATKGQFVTTTPDWLPFGHGKHACPGRFFASNEVKIALCHLLLKYDWELAPGTTAKPIIFGQFMVIDPKAALRCRRRKEEIDLESLQCE